jgi:hypothetical protein
VTGNATYGWSAAAARLQVVSFNLVGWAALGDTVYLSSDHAETQSTALIVYSAGNDATPVLFISVNRAGSVPPVAADILPGASISTTGANSLAIWNNGWWEGITFSAGNAANGASINLNPNTSRSSMYFKNCALVLNNTAGGQAINVGNTNAGSSYTFDNTSVQFGSVSQTVAPGGVSRFEWLNTAVPIIGATLPTNFLSPGYTNTLLRGLDLSALGSGKTLVNASISTWCRIQFENCKLGASVTPVSPAAQFRDVSVSLINCDSGATGYRNEFYSFEGSIVTETTITRASGASDGVQAISWKGVGSGNNYNNYTAPLRFAPICQWNSLTGSGRTATVEIISSATLTNDDIVLDLEYLGSSGSPLGSIVTTAIATRLTTPASLPTSIKTWNASPATPVKQYLQVTFTPQMAGLVVARVQLRKAGAIVVYVDPLITIV